MRVEGKIIAAAISISCFLLPTISGFALSQPQDATIREHSAAKRSTGAASIGHSRIYDNLERGQSPRTFHRIIPSLQHNFNNFMNRFVMAPENKQASVGFTNLLNMFPFLRRTSFYNEPNLEQKPTFMSLIPKIFQNLAAPGTPVQKM